MELTQEDLKYLSMQATFAFVIYCFMPVDLLIPYVLFLLIGSAIYFDNSCMHASI